MLLMGLPRRGGARNAFAFIIGSTSLQGGPVPETRAEVAAGVTMDRADVIAFYDRHPINEGQILALARARRADGGPLAAADLFEFDQDHYGGLAAVEALARRAHIDAGTRVVDLCAGLGGPARFLAARLGCRVVAVELNHARAAGAARLGRLVRLAPLVRVVRADVSRLPLAPASVDAAISQEGLLHVADKAAVLAEARRVLRPGGRLAFTDWVAHPRLGEAERTRLRTWMAATTLQTVDGYRSLLGGLGFAAVAAEDVTDEWRGILNRRREMLRAQRAETVARLGEAAYDDYRRLFDFFVGLVEAGKLGGGRFSASR
jgi:sarcosine/dimethylglycine N-methyltransferase